MSSMGKLALALGLAVVMSAGPPAHAASQFVGKRALKVLENISEIHFCSLTVTEKDGKIDVELGAILPNFKSFKVEDVKSDGKSLHFALKNGPATFRVALYPTKEKQLRGSFTINGQVLLAFSEPVDDPSTEITPANAATTTAGGVEIGRLMREKDKEKRIKGLSELVEKNQGKPIELVGLSALYEVRTDAGAPADAIKKDVERALKAAASYGAEVEANALVRAGQVLLRGKSADLALEYAQKAVEKADEPAMADAFPAGRKIQVLNNLIQAQVKADAPADAIKKTIARSLKLAAEAGPGGETNALVGVAKALLKGKNGDLALEYARKVAADVKDDTPSNQALPRLKLLAAALHKAGKADEAKEVDGRVSKVETKLDEEFEKGAIGFEPEAFAGRSSKSDRVVVVELFTGAQCPPCVAADIAFDAALKSFKPKDVVLLQYHLHIPGPDPLTNADSEARSEFYKDDVQGTPTAFINGKVTEPMGGFKPNGEKSFKTLSSALKNALELTPKAQITLKADRKGDDLDISATVDDVQFPGEKMRLRFVLVEEQVRYPGRNGQRLHHHVVRAFPGGIDGFALKEKSAKKDVKFSLKELRESLESYLEKAGTQRPFLDDERPLDLKHLKVVALVQDDDSKEIVQAAEVDVP
jgi:hypothetical protein